MAKSKKNIEYIHKFQKSFGYKIHLSKFVKIKRKLMIAIFKWFDDN